MHSIGLSDHDVINDGARFEKNQNATRSDDIDDNLDADSSHLNAKRLERSLGESCRKFLELFGAKTRDTVEHINVDHCIKKLGINRRRIYDIINILESFQMIKRLKKNEYEIRSAMFIHDIIVDIEVS